MTPAATVVLFLASCETAALEWFEAGEASLTGSEVDRLPARRLGDAWKRHILSRRLVRFAVSSYLGRSDIVVDYPKDSAPILKGHDLSGVNLSLSHCGENAAVAIASGVAIGCDILTRSRRVRWSEISSSFFSEAEAAWISEPHAPSRERFDRLWCAKELLAKLSGQSLFEFLRRDIKGETDAGRYHIISGVIRKCRYAVASDSPFAIELRAVPLARL